MPRGRRHTPPTAPPRRLPPRLANSLSLYNNIITARILLSWFPQAQGQPLLQPLFIVTDPFLNLFRGIIPPIGGLDLSVLPAFFLLSALGNAVPALSAGPELLAHAAAQM